MYMQVRLSQYDLLSALIREEEGEEEEEEKNNPLGSLAATRRKMALM